MCLNVQKHAMKVLSWILKFERCDKNTSLCTNIDHMVQHCFLGTNVQKEQKKQKQAPSSVPTLNKRVLLLSLIYIRLPRTHSVSTASPTSGAPCLRLIDGNPAGVFLQ